MKNNKNDQSKNNWEIVWKANLQKARLVFINMQKVCVLTSN